MRTTLKLLIFFLSFIPLNTFSQNFPYTSLDVEGHTRWVVSVAFSRDGEILASGGDDDSIRLWNVATGTLLQTLIGHTSAVSGVAFSPDGEILASGSYDRTIRLWNVVTGTLLQTLEGHANVVRSVAFSPDGEILASGGDDSVHLWDVTTGTLLRVHGHTDVFSVAFSPDGKTFASGSGATFSKSVRLWDVATDTLLQVLGGGRYSKRYFSIAFSPDGEILASGGAGSTGRSGYVDLWNARTGNLIRTLESGHQGSIRMVLSVAFSPDGEILAGGTLSEIHLWNARTGELLQTLEGHTDSVDSVAFSPDGEILASGSNDETIRLWKLSSNRVRIIPHLITSPAIGEKFSINVDIVDGKDVGGYQFTLRFDQTILNYISSTNGDYLSTGAFFVPPVISGNSVTLGATSLANVSDGDGTLATVTFEVLDVKESFIGLFDVILTDSAGKHLHFLSHSASIETSALSSSAVLRLTPSTILSPAIGEHLTLNVDIADGQNVADFQLTYDFDESALKYISKSQSTYLAGGVGNGDGTLETVTFEVLDVKASTVGISGYLVATNGLRYLPTFETAEVVAPIFGDVNRDGSVNILDLVLVASKFGQRVSADPADVNEDGIVNIVDLVKVAGAVGGEAAAPSALSLGLENTFTREQVQQWLSEARQFNLTDTTVQRGILFLERLLAALTPKETALLANYPNPFNPETWIPYQLAAPADVTVTIYAVDGTVVRILPLGHQPIGTYQSKSRAAYWDGKNEVGEPVASSIYFYTLKAGDFTATRKMLIRK